jgi:cytochrome P450
MHPPGPIHSLLIEEDPPQSLKWRQPLYPWFSPATVKRWHPKMAAYTTWFIDQKIETGAMDLVVDLASALPTVITLARLGVSVDRWGEYASANRNKTTPVPGSEESIAAYAVMSELTASVVEVVADRRTDPRPDDFPTWVWTLLRGSSDSSGLTCGFALWGGALGALSG